MSLTAGREHFHVLAKPTGAICNLDCEYCFFLSKEELYPGSSFRMSDDVLEAYVGQLLDAQRGADEIVVAFQGGEPTMMGVEFFERVRAVYLARAAAEPERFRIIDASQAPDAVLDAVGSALTSWLDRPR